MVNKPINLQNKQITVLVALYKSGEFLQTKIDNLLQQTAFKDANIILLNCQDKNQESKIYANFVEQNNNVTAIEYTEHKRLYSTWNDGIISTESDYICNSNVDDMWHPDFLQCCKDWLDIHIEFCCITTGILLTHKPNQIYPKWEWDDKFPFYAYPMSTAGPCLFWRRSLHDKYGYFENYRVIGDARLWEKWYAGGEKFGLLQKDLVLYYAHSGSLERRTDKLGRTFESLDIAEASKNDTLTLANNQTNNDGLNI